MRWPTPYERAEIEARAMQVRDEKLRWCAFGPGHKRHVYSWCQAGPGQLPCGGGRVPIDKVADSVIWNATERQAREQGDWSKLKRYGRMALEA